MRRIALALFVFVIFALIAGVVAVQIVLWGDYPRRLIEENLQDQTGLDVTIDSVSTGWFGESSLHGVIVKTPLADEPLFEAPRIDVTHADLLMLIIGRPLALENVEINSPTISIREDVAGQWNLERAIEVVRRTQESKEAGGGGDVPRITVVRGSVKVAPHDADEVTYTPLEFLGEPDSSQAWAFRLKIADRLEATGRTMTSTPGIHTVEFRAEDIQTALGPWFDDPTILPQAVTGRWEGRFAGSRASGRLVLDSLVHERGRASGVAHLAFGDEGQFVIRAEGIAIEPTWGDLPPDTIRVAQGAVTLDGASLRARSIVIDGWQTNARISGEWDGVQGNGQIRASWSGVRPALELSHSGEFVVDVTAPDIGPIEAVISGRGEAVLPIGEAAIETTARLQGKFGEEMTARVGLPRARWSDAIGVVTLDGTEFDLRYDEPLVRLTRLRVPVAEVDRAGAQVNTETNEWSVDLAAENLQLPRWFDPVVDASIAVTGTRDRVDFSRVHVSGEGAELHGSGTYIPGSDVPLQANVRMHVADLARFRAPRDAEAREATAEPSVLRAEPRESAGPPAASAEADPAAPQPPEAERPSSPPPPSSLTAEVELSGSIEPLQIAYDGSLTAQHVPVAAGSIDAVTMPWRGDISRERSTFRASEFNLLSGTWTIDGHFLTESRHLEVALAGSGVPLDRLVQLLDLPVEASGVLDTTIDFAIDEFDVDDLELRGTWNVRDLESPRLLAETGSGEFETSGRNVIVRNLELRQGDRGVLGGEVTFNRDDKRRLGVDIQATSWPVEVEGSNALLLLSGAATGSVDIVDATGTGVIDVTADAYLDNRSLGAFELEGTVEGRAMTVTRFGGNAFGGSIEGSGQVPLDNWLGATGDLRWSDIDLQSVTEFLPLLEDVSGRSSGAATLLASDDPRRTEPLRVEADATTREGRYREIAIGDVSLLAYVDRDRFVIHRSTWQVAGGTVELWGKMTPHAGERYVHGFAVLSDLEIDQFLQSFAEGSETTPGLVGGRLSIGGYPDQKERSYRAFGTGRLELAKADLGSVPLFAQLFDLLALDFDRDEPEGYGAVELALEGSTLRLTRFEYFNRGTEVVGTAEFDDVWRGGASPMSGLVVGAVRPFRELDLPLSSDLDRLVRALQADAVSLRLSGTLAEPEYKTVPFSEVGRSIERLLQSALAD